MGFFDAVFGAEVKVDECLLSGFSGVPPPGPAIPVTDTATSAPPDTQRTLRHLRRHIVAHRSLTFQRLVIHADDGFLGGVA
ncbi:MAG: hypothetical protein R2856_14625 [Caldilineaceae bacterium]